MDSTINIRFQTDHLNQSEFQFVYVSNGNKDFRLHSVELIEVVNVSNSADAKGGANAEMNSYSPNRRPTHSPHVHLCPSAPLAVLSCSSDHRTSFQACSKSYACVSSSSVGFHSIVYFFSPFLQSVVNILGPFWETSNIP